MKGVGNSKSLICSSQLGSRGLEVCCRSGTVEIFGHRRIAKPFPRGIEGPESMLGLGEGLQPLFWWKVFDQIGTSSLDVFVCRVVLHDAAYAPS